MEIERGKRYVKFRSEDGAMLDVGYDNRGEPYRQGISLALEDVDRFFGRVFLETREVCALRDLLNDLYPARK